jgi:hypothetical protein
MKRDAEDGSALSRQEGLSATGLVSRVGVSEEARLAPNLLQGPRKKA